MRAARGKNCAATLTVRETVNAARVELRGVKMVSTWGRSVSLYYEQEGVVGTVPFAGVQTATSLLTTRVIY
jgi:hypothetical protein